MNQSEQNIGTMLPRWYSLLLLSQKKITLNSLTKNNTVHLEECNPK